MNLNKFYVYRQTLRPNSPDLAFYSYFKGLAGFNDRQNIEPKKYLGRMTESELTKFSSSTSEQTRVPRILRSRKSLFLGGYTARR